MKFKKAFIPLLLTTVMLAGCGSKDKNKSEIIKNDFNEVRKEAQEIIKTAKYDNLDIKCDSVIFPETDKIATWWIDTIYLNEWKKPDELVNYIIDDMTPELIGDISMMAKNCVNMRRKKTGIMQIMKTKFQKPNTQKLLN